MERKRDMEREAKENNERLDKVRDDESDMKNLTFNSEEVSYVRFDQPIPPQAAS